MSPWSLFTHQATEPPREPLVPKRRSCAWCGVMLTGPCNQKYCSEQCSTRSQYIKKAANKELAAMTKLWENEYRLRCEAQAREKVLIEAAQAVVDRWESPLWKVQESTASFIYTLQKALALPQDSSALDALLAKEYGRGYQESKDKYGDLT